MSTNGGDGVETGSGTVATDGYRLGVDIGGTFTDVVLLGSDGTMRTRKILSTPDDYAQGVIDGAVSLLESAGVAPGEVTAVVHATTVASNTVLEGRGARTALITTEGFRDVLEMRRLRIPVMYDLQYDKPSPLVPRRRRLEIAGRMGPRGDVWRALDTSSVHTAAEAVRRDDVEAVAICLLHSYSNPDHEHEAAEILKGVVGDDVYVTCSTDILPEIREYERTSTAVVNAYLGPAVSHYVRSLSTKLVAAGITAPLEIMQSAGGTMSPSAAVRRPAYLVESGPAAGVIACAHLARLTNRPNVISFDMGGTTAKAAMLENGEPVRTMEYEIGGGINLSSRLVKGGGYAIKLPFIDLSEIGAGGGSIVGIDEFGRASVGPRSAGAAPGPVCYGRGGEEPTLADALIVLGFLNSRQLAGGAVSLDVEAARDALRDRVADRLGLSVLEAAHGVLMVAVGTMTRAVKAVSTYRGRDPRDFALCAFGGNGPVVGVEIARALSMRQVLVPPAPGVFSAVGLLFSQTEQEFVRTVLLRAGDIDEGVVAAAYASLAERSGRVPRRGRDRTRDRDIVEARRSPVRRPGLRAHGAGPGWAHRRGAPDERLRRRARAHVRARVDRGSRRPRVGPRGGAGRPCRAGQPTGPLAGADGRGGDVHAARLLRPRRRAPRCPDDQPGGPPGRGDRGTGVRGRVRLHYGRPARLPRRARRIREHQHRCRLSR